MESKKRKIIQQVNQYSLFAVGLVAFIALAGEEDPQNPVSFGDFCLIKGAALAVLLGCVGIGKLLGRHGLLPSDKDNEEVRLWRK